MQVHCEPITPAAMNEATEFLGFARQKRKSAKRRIKSQTAVLLFFVFSVLMALGIVEAWVRFPRGFDRVDLALFGLFCCLMVLCLIMGIGTRINIKTGEKRVASQGAFWRWFTPEGVYARAVDESSNGYSAWRLFERVVVTPNLYVLEGKTGVVMLQYRAEVPDPAAFEALVTSALGSAALVRYAL